MSIQDILKGIENGKDLSFIATTLFLDAIEPLAKHFKPKDHFIRIDEQEDRKKIYDSALIIRSQSLLAICDIHLRVCRTELR